MEATKTSALYEKLAIVQRDLKCNKSQYNSFGKYSYRSCEDIFEAAKPLCCDNGLLLTTSDEIAVIQDRIYVKATATVIDVEDGKKFSVTAYAREEESKKGMDASQVTGSCSSYARKYALNGLFCIDDTKDADTMDNSGNTQTQQRQTAKQQTSKTTEAKQQKPKEPQTVKDYYDLVVDYARQSGSVAYIVQILKRRFNKAKFTELSLVEAKAFWNNIDNLIETEKQLEAEDDARLMEGVG